MCQCYDNIYMSHPRANPDRDEAKALAPLLQALTRSFAQRKDGKADATTERILRAGIEEFTEFGFRRAAIEDIARRAGISRMTIYRRYSTKEALGLAIIVREMQAFMTAVDRAVDRNADFETRLVEGFATTIQTAREHELFRRMLVTDPEIIIATVTVRARPMLRLARTYLAGFFRANLKHLNQRDADWAAETALRLVQSFVLTRDVSIHADSADELREYARRYVVPMITGRARGS